MRADIAFSLIVVLVLSTGTVGMACGGKKERTVESEPILIPEPRRLGKCNRVVEQYLPNNFWRGYDECAYAGWMWDCPSAIDAQSECHRRVNGQLPPERP